MMQRNKGVDLAIVIASFVLALVLAEISLRVFFPQSVAQLGRGGPGMRAHPPNMYVANDDTGYSLRPGFSGLFVRPEYQTPVNINEQGMRGPPVRARGPDSFRILAIGDSFTWGYGATEDQAWPYLLENALAERFPARDIQVLNAGVPGYGNDEELAWLQSLGAKTSPDLVITMFFAGNDFEDNVRHARDTHVIEDGMLVDLSARQRMAARPAWTRVNDWLKARSELMSLVSNRLGYLSMRLGLHTWLAKASSEHFSESDGKRASKLLTRIVDVSQSMGARHLLVFVPEKTQVLSGGGGTVRAAEVVKRAASSTETPWLDLTPVLREPGHRTRAYYVLDGHWTPEGNAIAAKEIETMITSGELLTAPIEQR